MATLTAPTSASARATRPQSKVAAGSISSLRVRPFTHATRSVAGAPRQQVLVRAAEPEAAIAEEFSFNYSDAKKANEYTASDVEAALKFFDGEGGAPGDVNSEFVENAFGVEDASFFDDIDNNDAYDDEFVCAGIPEAAPKAKGRQQRGGDVEGADADSDDISAAKEAEKLKQREEQMVLAAELEETGLDQVGKKDTKTVGPAVWDWMNDVNVDEDDDELNKFASSSSKSMSAKVLSLLPTDEEIFWDMRRINTQELDPETRDEVEFLMDDFDLENELQAIPDQPEDAFALPAVEGNVEDDMARIDALMKEIDEGALMGDDDLANITEVEALEDDGVELSEGAVENYVAAIRAADGADLTDEEIKDMFGDDPLQPIDPSNEAPVTMDDVDLTEPEVAVVAQDDVDFEALEGDAGEFGDDVLLEVFRAEMNALSRTPDVSLEALPAEEIDVLEQYLSASEVFLAAEEDRKMRLAAQVQAGELPSDVLDEEEFVDVEQELLTPDDMDDLAEEMDDFEDDENWQERILELTRVTKVVKGGKLMGFRCTAVVGNNNGLVGVGCQAGREISTAVKRALVDAKKSVVQVPLVGAGTVPHRVEAKFNAARCVILPAADGTGVLAGGAIRSVLELAGVQNVLAKRLGCRSLLNNARCAVSALEKLRTLQDVSRARGVPMERLLLPRK